MNSEKILVDTTVWVLFFRGDESVKDKMLSLILEDKIVTTEIVIMETLRGAKSKKEYSQLYDDFTAIPLLHFDKAYWERCYMVGFQLLRAGITVPITDILIAVQAAHYNHPLLHRDKHFPLMAKIIGLEEIQI